MNTHTAPVKCHTINAIVDVKRRNIHVLKEHVAFSPSLQQTNKVNNLNATNILRPPCTIKNNGAKGWTEHFCQLCTPEKWIKKRKVFKSGRMCQHAFTLKLVKLIN